MKKSLKIISILSILILILTSFSFTVNATEVDDTKQIIVNENAVEQTAPTTGNDEVSVFDSAEAWSYKDIYKCSSKDLVLQGIVDGNVYIICNGDLTISGEIGGDAFIIANKVTIEGGYVYSNLFIVADELVVNGIVYDIYGCCSKITVGEQGVIARDLRAVCDNITLNGAVYRNCFLSTNNLTVGDTAKVSGSITYDSSNETTIPEGAVSGDIVYNKTVEKQHKVSVLDTVIKYVNSAFSAIFFALIILVISLLLSKNNFIELISDKLTHKWGSCIGYGFAALLGIPVVSIIFLSMNCSAIIGLALLIVYMMFLVLSSGVTTVAISNIVCKKFNKTDLLTTAGITALVALVLWVIKLIPYLGGLVSFATLILGLGLLMFNIFKNVPAKEKKVKVVEVKEETK